MEARYWRAIRSKKPRAALFSHPPRLLRQVDSLRKARLQAADYKFALERATNELEAKGQALEQLQARVDALAAAAAAPPAALEAELRAARADAERSKRKLAAAELELARQLDALQELQGRLDAVVGQLALERQWQRPQQPQQSGVALSSEHDALSSKLLLSSTTEELRSARLAAEEYKRRLALAELQLSAARAAAATADAPLQPAATGESARTHGAGSPGALLRPRAVGELESDDGEEAGEDVRQGYAVRMAAHGAAAAAVAEGGASALETARLVSQHHVQHSTAQASTLGPCGRELVAGLMKDNQELRARLRNAERHACATEARRRAELAAAAWQGGGTAAARLLQQRLEEQEAAAERLRGSLAAAEAQLVEAFQRQAEL